MAALRESVETDEESVRSNLPGLFGLSLVVEVGILKGAADIESERELGVSLLGLRVLNRTEDEFAVNSPPALHDHCVADLTDENKQTCWRVVVA